MAAHSLQAEIEDLEDQTWKALSVDGKSLLPFLSKDCIFLFPYGMRVSESTEPSIHQVMVSDAFVPWKTYRMSDVTVTPISDTGAAISYRVKARRVNADEREHSFRALVSSIWRKGGPDGKWQLCLHQQTPFELEIEDIAEAERH